MFNKPRLQTSPTRPAAFLSLLTGICLPQILALLFFTSWVIALEQNIVNDSDNPKPVEVMTIDQVEYEIPPPWRGNRFKNPKLTFASFAKIPSQYCKNNTKLYILKKAHPHLIEMLTHAKQEGILIQVESAYRSASYQKKIFKQLLAEGRTFEDIIRYVAPPGYSEHMLGTAIDFYPSNWYFADTPQHQWLQENAFKYGFTNTYPESNSLKMPWEAWHWNYTVEPLE